MIFVDMSEKYYRGHLEKQNAFKLFFQCHSFYIPSAQIPWYQGIKYPYAAYYKQNPRLKHVIKFLLFANELYFLLQEINSISERFFSIQDLIERHK